MITVKSMNLVWQMLTDFFVRVLLVSTKTWTVMMIARKKLLRLPPNRLQDVMSCWRVILLWFIILQKRLGKLDSADNLAKKYEIPKFQNVANKWNHEHRGPCGWRLVIRLLYIIFIMIINAAISLNKKYVTIRNCDSRSILRLRWNWR